MDQIVEAAIEPGAEAVIEQVPEQIIEQEAPAEPEVVKFTKEEWERKERTAVRNRDRKIGKLEEQLSVIPKLQAQLAKYEQSIAPQKPNRPDESKYNNALDYIEALGKHNTDEVVEARLAKFQEDQLARQQQAEYIRFAQQQQGTLRSEWGNLLKEAPDAQSILEEYGDMEFPDHVTSTIMQLDSKEVITAFYNLGKEGKLDALANMSPVQIAATIARAQQPIKKPQTKAPAPLTPAKGTGSYSKGLSQMSAKELVAWANNTN